MITFILFFAVLIIGYIFYSRFIERVFGADNRPTPSSTNSDGVDFIPMSTWKIFLIQLLNIAGTGPIFGALSGALFGPVVYIWIVLGGIFAGAVHDYMAGMISMRNNGVSLLEIYGKYFGKTVQNIVGIVMVVLLIMVGSLFSRSPAELLSMITPDRFGITFWMMVIICYYFMATFLPVDKIIGKIYPLFGICLIVMATGIIYYMLFSGNVHMPELWDNFENMHPQKVPIYPFMFITVACGAISGFHATQSPIMVRCCRTEKECRRIFYGAMITESLIALVWAAAGVSFYEDSQALLAAGGGCSAVVYHICRTSFGKIGCVLALLGVVFCPISTGDTAYRAIRLIIADRFRIDQRDWKKRLCITISVITAGTLLCYVEFAVLWRYFAWVNQILGTLTLWACTIYLRLEKKNYFVTMLPAIFMTIIVCGYAVMQFF